MNRAVVVPDSLRRHECTAAGPTVLFRDNLGPKISAANRQIRPSPSGETVAQTSMENLAKAVLAYSLTLPAWKSNRPITRTVVQSFNGYVENIQDGIANAILEDEQGREIYVRYRAEKLKAMGIEERGAFRYTVFDTGNGSASRFEPLPPEQLSDSEQQEIARRAAEIFKNFPDTTHHATA